jgi:hypothetical protein
VLRDRGTGAVQDTESPCFPRPQPRSAHERSDRAKRAAAEAGRSLPILATARPKKSRGGSGRMPSTTCSRSTSTTLTIRSSCGNHRRGHFACPMTPLRFKRGRGKSNTSRTSLHGSSGITDSRRRSPRQCRRWWFGAPFLLGCSSCFCPRGRAAYRRRDGRGDALKA